METKPQLKHKKLGTVSMVNGGNNMLGSQVWCSCQVYQSFVCRTHVSTHGTFHTFCIHCNAKIWTLPKYNILIIFRSRILRNRMPWLAVAQSSFSRYRPLIQTAHIYQHYNFELRFCPQIKLKTSYSWEHLVEVSKMNANFHVQSVTGVWMFFVFYCTCHSHHTCSVSVVNQKLLLANFRGKNIYVIYRPWSVRIDQEKTLPSVLNARTLACSRQSFSRYRPPSR